GELLVPRTAPLTLRFPARGCAASRRRRTSETAATAAVMPAASTNRWRFRSDFLFGGAPRRGAVAPQRRLLRRPSCRPPRRAGAVGSAAMHLRPPSIDHGIISFVWALVLGVLLWLFMIGIGISKPTAFIVSAVAGCAIFLYVRLYGEDEVRPRRASR